MNKTFLQTPQFRIIVLDHPVKPGNDGYWRRVMTILASGDDNIGVG
jgi:hypothetical protein